MYDEKRMLKDFYHSVMDRMEDDLKVEDEHFDGSLTDDYLQGILSGLNTAKHIFNACYREAYRK